MSNRDKRQVRVGVVQGQQCDMCQQPGGSMNNDTNTPMPDDELVQQSAEHERRPKMPMQIEQGFAAPQWDAASLAGQVAELERKIDVLRDIAGAAVATMKVNRERGTLKIDDPECGARFDGWVEAWNKRLNEFPTSRYASPIRLG